jgi:outer membrane protein assembly factor BamD
MKLKIAVPALILLSICTTGCKTTPISEMSPEKGLSEIKKNYNDKDWSIVINDVNEYKARYPYSALIVEANIMQADSYFQSNQYPDAISVYEEFIKKNPNNPKVGFAIFRIAQCYDIQAPDNDDRDQANTKKALGRYQEFIARQESGENTETAKTRILALDRRVYEHDAFIAYFYWKKDLYAAALSRYLEIIRSSNYPDLVSMAKKRAHDCYLKLAEELKENPKSDAYVYFKNETTESLKEKAEQILN